MTYRQFSQILTVRSDDFANKLIAEGFVYITSIPRPDGGVSHTMGKPKLKQRASAQTKRTNALL